MEALPIMGFFSGMGNGELLLVFVFVFLLFGPEQLPKIIRTLGKVLSDLRRASEDFKDEIIKIEDSVARPLKEEVNRLTEGVIAQSAELTEPIEAEVISVQEGEAPQKSADASAAEPAGEPHPSENEKSVRPDDAAKPTEQQGEAGAQADGSGQHPAEDAGGDKEGNELAG